MNSTSRVMTSGSHTLARVAPWALSFSHVGCQALPEVTE